MHCYKWHTCGVGLLSHNYCNFKTPLSGGSIYLNLPVFSEFEYVGREYSGYWIPVKRILS
jgi:hypothetical protein